MKLKPTKDRNNSFMLLWYSHPRIAIALSLVLINLAVIFVFSVILAIISGNSFFGELSYIFTYTMCSDGIYDFVNSEEDLACFVVKIVLTVIQMIIFSGALIGFTTNILQSTIDKRLNNLGKMNLTGHYVFLNWSSIGAHLIYDLSFLEGYKNVVILSEEDRDDVAESIQNIFTENKKRMTNIRVFIKRGNPSSPKHLDDVSLNRASYVGVLLPNNDNSEQRHAMSGNDINSLKTLFTIMNTAEKANIVVEVESTKTVTKIEQLLQTINPKLNKRIIVFSHGSVLGHILGRTVVKSTFSNLYHDLLSYDGCEFYGIPTMDIEEALYNYNDCIPIINYDDDDELDESGNLNPDQLYILSDTKNSLGQRDKKQQMVIPLKYRERQNTESEDNFTFFVFSQTGTPDLVIEELNRSSGGKIVCHSYSYGEDISIIAQSIKEMSGKKKILLLSSDDGCHENEDEDIFLSALSLKINGCIDENTEVLAEITNPANLTSLRNFGVMSVIISNRIISLFMIQLLTHPGSKKFYRDLISSNDDSGNDSIDLDVVNAGDLLEFDGNPLKFKNKSELVQSFYFASKKTKMCIGVRFKGDDQISFLCDRMDAPEEITLTENDELILVCY